MALVVRVLGLLQTAILDFFQLLEPMRHTMERLLVALPLLLQPTILASLVTPSLSRSTEPIAFHSKLQLGTQPILVMKPLLLVVMVLRYLRLRILIFRVV